MAGRQEDPIFIIIEGPDGAGKSTLARGLVEALGDSARLLHRGPPERHPIYEYETSIYWEERYAPGDGVDLVCDRWHVGEAIYPKILDRASKLDAASWWHIESFLISRGALLVHVTGDPDAIAERVRDRGDDLIESSQTYDIVSSYFDHVSASRLPRILVGMHDTKDPATVSRIVARACHYEHAYAKIAAFTTYVGVANPEVLLLGDVRNVFAGIREHVRSPAFMPFPSTSGRYLIDTVLSMHTDRVGIANACDSDDAHALWMALGRPRVVALGNNAWRAIKAWAEPEGYAEVDHPQFIRRFHWHQRDEYAEALETGRTPSWRR